MHTVNDSPSIVIAENGTVLVDGPNGIVVTLTPGAALETADRLIDAATQAQGQRLMSKIRFKQMHELKAGQ